jgi:hypothetical protein
MQSLGIFFNQIYGSFSSFLCWLIVIPFTAASGCDIISAGTVMAEFTYIREHTGATAGNLSIQITKERSPDI